MTDITCKFKYLCPFSWEDLEQSEETDLKFCTHCESNVHRANDEQEFEDLARSNKCVAFEESGIMFMGTPEPIPRHYYLQIPEQNLTNQQITKLRNIIEPELSEEEVMLKYDNNSEQFVDIGSHEDARLVWKKLKAISVESHLNSRKLTRK